MTDTNVFDKRAAGVLLSVSSLPGPFGTGVFGREARDFIDRLKRMDFSFWQVLPLGPLDRGNSPYCGESAFAGNTLYVDPRGLSELGLVTDEDIYSCIYRGSPHTADYGFARFSRENVLRKAYRTFRENRDAFPLTNDFNEFVKTRPWLRPYAEFKAKKELSGGTCWNTWNEELFSERKEELDDLIEYYSFVQFLFFFQWKNIKKYANENGIRIIGDMPLYIDYDSADVYSDPGDFQIDPSTFKPEKVAGVPPDYFSEEGQLWGNPLYNWTAMKKNGFRWWKERLASALDLYDVVRIDHFRGLASYWAVPYGAKSAKDGHWEKGPGLELFEAFKEIPGYTKDRLIAEDLGVFGQDVTDLLRNVGLPGMRVIQFAFDESRASTNLPHNYDKNSVAYVGTHDNNTVLGWLWEADPKEKEFALRYCGFKGADWEKGGYKSESCRAMTEAVWKSPAKLSVVSLQDMCGYGKDCRMNTPGEPEGNWLFRTTVDALSGIDEAYYREINSIFGRSV